MKRILILYRELAGYFVECLNHLCESRNVEAVLVAYPVNADAPFQFNLSPKVTLISRHEVDNAKLITLASDPTFNLIFCGGWADKGYLEALKKRKTSSLLGFDNQWNGSLKHRMSALYGRWKIKPLFDYAFVPGSKQKEFAMHLGFAESNIILKAYSCDVSKFSAIANQHQAKKPGDKKRLIYTGRYSEEKFILQLQQVMSELLIERKSEWELHCAGTGPLWENRLTHPAIVHHGFMQPSSLFELMKTGDAFILPSTFEPWGVVVHEFASAGFPLLLSSNVGSSEIFLKSGENGYMFKSGDITDMRNKIQQLISSTPDQLEKMGKKSAELAHHITPETWANSLYQRM
jgi:glycosyltransferase involved in cell wall biosynthesis